MDQPHEIHWREAKRILKFVQGTRTHGIFYKAKYDLELVGFTNSDWASDNKDQNSTSGYVFMLTEGPISWSSKKQSAIALSSTEAEYQRSCKCSYSMFMVAGGTWRMWFRIRVFNSHLL